MPRYKVLESGFFGGIFRVPGGPHDPVVTSKPFKKGETPKWLEEIKPSKTRKKAAAEVIEPNASAADFMGGDDKDVETL